MKDNCGSPGGMFFSLVRHNSTYTRFKQHLTKGRLRFIHKCILLAEERSQQMRLHSPSATSVSDPHCSPSGVELVNHAWQDLRSGVPLSPRGGGRAEATYSLNRSRLTRGSNRATCSYITFCSTGRKAHVRLWHPGLKVLDDYLQLIFNRQSFSF